MVELGSNLALAMLLVLTTIWCLLLHRRLGRLRVERHDIEAFVDAVTTATKQAEAATGGLRAAAADVQSTLAKQQRLAQQCAAELTRLAESGNRTARRLETALHHGTRTLVEAAPGQAWMAGSAGGVTERHAPAAPATVNPHRGESIDPALRRALEALR